MQMGRIIRKLRAERNLTQKDVAEAIQMNQSNFSKVELDLQELSLSQLVSLALYFGVTTDYLLGIESKKVIRTQDQINQFKEELDRLFVRYFK